MKDLWKYFFLGMILSLSFAAGWAIRREYQKPKVLSEKVNEDITPSGPEALSPSRRPSSSPSPSPTPVLTPTPSPIPTPTFTPMPTPIPLPTYSSEEIHGFIERFAGQYAVDPNVLRHIAVCESGFNPKAQSLSYAGLYQFGPGVWQRYRVRMGEDTNTDLRFNVEEAVQTAAYVLSVNEAYIWPNCVP